MSNKEDIFIVEDMHCNSCAKTIKKALSSNDAVSDIETNVDTKEVKVTYDDENFDVEEILSSLDTVGFPATIKKKPWMLQEWLV